MGLDERVREYLDGFFAGISERRGDLPEQAPRDPDGAQGYGAGRAAWAAAERAARELLMELWTLVGYDGAGVEDGKYVIEVHRVNGRGDRRGQVARLVGDNPLGELTDAAVEVGAASGLPPDLYAQTVIAARRRARR